MILLQKIKDNNFIFKIIIKLKIHTQGGKYS